MPRKKKREEIELSKEDFLSLTYGDSIFDEDENELYVLVEDEIIYHDSEKSYVDKEIIIRRVADNKYFKGTYSKWGAGNTQIDNLILEEVFPKVIKQTIYE